MAIQSSLRAFFAFAILQNKTLIVSNLNANGYPTSLDVSNQDLVDLLYKIYFERGSNEITKIFANVKLRDTNAARQLSESITGIDMSQSKTLLETLQELWGGVKDTIGGSEETTTKPIINPIAAIAVTIIGIIVVSIIALKS